MLLQNFKHENADSKLCNGILLDSEFLKREVCLSQRRSEAPQYLTSLTWSIIMILVCIHGVKQVFIPRQ